MGWSWAQEHKLLDVSAASAYTMGTRAEVQGNMARSSKQGDGGCLGHVKGGEVACGWSRREFAVLELACMIGDWCTGAGQRPGACEPL